MIKMKKTIIIGIMIALMTQLVLGATCPSPYWLGSYNITITNDGSQLPRYNEIIIIENISNINTYYSNKTDMLLLYDGNNYTFQWLGAQKGIFFIANLTTSTSNSTNFILCTNNSNEGAYRFNSTIAEFVQTFDNWEYAYGTAINGNSGWTGQSANMNDITASYASYRGSGGLVNNMTSNGGGGIYNNYPTNATMLYYSAYTTDRTSSAQTDFHLGNNAFGGGELKIILTSGYNTQTFGVANGTTTTNFGYDYNNWIAWNAQINLTHLINVTGENVTKAVTSLVNIPNGFKTDTNLTGIGLANNGVQSFCYFDNLFISRNPIRQYINFSTTSLTYSSVELPMTIISVSGSSPSNITYWRNIPNMSGTCTFVAPNGGVFVDLLINGTFSGRNSTIVSTQSFTIVPNRSLVPFNEYNWAFQCGNGSLNLNTTFNNFYLMNDTNTGGTATSCVTSYTNAFFVPDGCDETI